MFILYVKLQRNIFTYYLNIRVYHGVLQNPEPARLQELSPGHKRQNPATMGRVLGDNNRKTKLWLNFF